MKTLSRFLLLLACLALALVPISRADDNAKAKALDQQLLQLYQSGKYQQAIPIAEKALQLREKTLGPNAPGTAIYLNNLAKLYDLVGDYAKAAPLLTRALAINDKSVGSNNTDTARRLHNVAKVYMVAGDFPKALPLLQRALAIREKALGPNQPDTVVTINDLSLVCGMMGDYATAVLLNQRLLKLFEKVLGPDHRNTAVILNSLAGLYTTMGDHTKAEPFVRRVLAINEKIYQPDRPEIADSLNSLASILRQKGDYAEAEPLYLRALAIYEKVHGRNSPNTATILTNLASVYDSMGDHAKAGPLLQRALTIEERAYRPDHPYIATSLINLTPFYNWKGDYAKVETLLRRALAILEKAFGPDHKSTVNTLGALSYVNIDLGRPAEATKLALRAAQVDEKLIANVLSFTSEQQRMAFQKTQDPYSLFASLGLAPTLAQKLLRHKAVVLDSLIEDRLVATSSRNPAQRETLAQLAAAKQRLMQLLLEMPKDFSNQARQRRESERETLMKKVEELEAGMARQVAALGRARRALSVTVAQVQDALVADQVLVELVSYKHYLMGDKREPRYGAVVIGRVGDPKWVVLGKADEIEKNLKLYQQTVRSSKNAEAVLSSLQQTLHQQLWAPIETVLPAGTRTVILSPDGELNFLSFATLLTPDNHFLCEKYSIRYVASGRDLLREFQSPSTLSMSIYANPDFTMSPVGSGQLTEDSGRVAMRSLELRDFSTVTLPPLPGTEREGTALAAQLKQAGMQTELFLGSRATEKQLNQLNGPRVLHLATHGFFLPDTEQEGSTAKANQRGMSVASSGSGDLMGSFGRAPSQPVALKSPMHRSGLALAGAQQTLQAWQRGETPPTDNDGIVTAEEVGSLKLNGTWLVTLSACETGIGEARAGEGVLGLRRGFIQAGAQNLLMTLWPVADEETVKLMTDFYNVAQQTSNAPQALANVQRDWLVKLRQEKGLWFAINRAGPFILSSQGPVK